MKKIFDENGNFKLQFATESTDQIKKWLQPVEYSHAIKFAKEVNCPVFGKALQFPCRIEAENLNKPQEQSCNIHDVVCSCYLCDKIIEKPREQFDMYGEIVCQDCWDYNMYQALQDGGGM